VSGYQEDRRRDSYVALHAWHERTGEPISWEQLMDPEAVLQWASADPDVSTSLRHRY
jgi:hypothetical protein